MIYKVSESILRMIINEKRIALKVTAMEKG